MSYTPELGWYKENRIGSTDKKEKPRSGPTSHVLIERWLVAYAHANHLSNVKKRSQYKDLQ